MPNIEISTWNKVLQNKSTKICHFGLVISSQVVDKLILEVVKAMIVECWLPE